MGWKKTRSVAYERHECQNLPFRPNPGVDFWGCTGRRHYRHLLRQRHSPLHRTLLSHPQCGLAYAAHFPLYCSSARTGSRQICKEWSLVFRATAKRGKVSPVNLSFQMGNVPLSFSNFVVCRLVTLLAFGHQRRIQILLALSAEQPLSSLFKGSKN
jgi:hypothetical protein